VKGKEADGGFRGGIEMLIHALKGVGGGEGSLTLRSEEGGAAGDNMEFLRSKLKWEVGEDGRERVMDADGNGWVMGTSRGK
jgi:protein arginine N-methyltransferase 2